MTLDCQVSHSQAEQNPSEAQLFEGSQGAVPFAEVRVRLFKDPFASDVGNSKQHRNAQREEFGDVLEGFEEVLQVNRHKSFRFLDIVRWCLADVGLMFFGFFFGTFVGMRIQQIITSGVVQ